MAAAGVFSPLRLAACALLALAAGGIPSVASAFHAEFMGMLGQSGAGEGKFIPWTGASWCTGDADSNVYLPGGWMLPRGETTPVRRKVPDGMLLFDGRTMYVWQRSRKQMSLSELKVVPEGLAKDGQQWTWSEWEWIPAVAPDGLARGVAERAKVVALDAKRGHVVGWRADGKSLGAVIDFSGESWARSACGVSFDPASGDVLVSTKWEVRKVFRFGKDGREVRKEGIWPASAYGGSLACERGRVWALGGFATPIGMLISDAKAGSFGSRAYLAGGIAWGGSGYWLATTQGVQYYPSTDPKTCRKRIGGLTGVTALALCRGRVLAVSGFKMHVMWLDDLADEPFKSDMHDIVGNRWRGEADGIDVEDGKFYIRDRESGETWCFDPEVTQWAFRAKRMFRCDHRVSADRRRAKMMGGVAVAEKDEIVVYGPDGRRECAIPERATSLAAEGCWLIAYVPGKSAILKYRISKSEDCPQTGSPCRIGASPPP